jgi:hypothetical protein
MSAVRFTGRVRCWREDLPDGLAVVDIPTSTSPALREAGGPAVTGLRDHLSS